MPFRFTHKKNDLLAIHIGNRSAKVKYMFV